MLIQGPYFAESECWSPQDCGKGFLNPRSHQKRSVCVAIYSNCQLFEDFLLNKHMCIYLTSSFSLVLISAHVSHRNAKVFLGSGSLINRLLVVNSPPVLRICWAGWFELHLALASNLGRQASKLSEEKTALSSSGRVCAATSIYISREQCSISWKGEIFLKSVTVKPSGFSMP